jgi:hypothetical protein
VNIQRYLSLHSFFFIITLISLGLSTYTLAQLHNFKKDLAQPEPTPIVAEKLPTSPLPSIAPSLNLTAEKEAASIQATLTDLQSQIDTLKKQPKTTGATTTSSQSQVYTLYLGTGSTINRDWTSLPSAAVTIDPAQYPKIKEVRFEAGLSILNGEAHARLYDLTTNTPYYATEVSNNTSAGAWKTSGTFQLPNQTHQYSVQLKSTSGEEANLIGARIKIVAQ